MARDHLERALSIDRQAYGEHHPDVARDYTALAELMRQLHDPAAADRYQFQAALVLSKITNSKTEETTLASIES